MYLKKVNQFHYLPVYLLYFSLSESIRLRHAPFSRLTVVNYELNICISTCLITSKEIFQFNPFCCHLLLNQSSTNYLKTQFLMFFYPFHLLYVQHSSIIKYILDKDLVSLMKCQPRGGLCHTNICCHTLAGRIIKGLLDFLNGN